MTETDYITPKRARRSARDMLLYRTLSGGGNALAVFLLLRALSEEAYGIYSLFMSVMPILAAVLSMGLGSTLQRFLPELVQRREYTLVKRLVLTVLVLRLLSLGLVAFVASFWVDELLAAFSLSPWSALVWPFLLVVFSDFQGRLMRLTLVAFLEMRLATANQVAFAAIKVAGYGLAWWQGWDLVAVFWIDVLAFAVLLVLLVHACLRRLARLQGPAPRFSPEERQRLLRYSLYYSFNDASGIPMGKATDQVFIGYYLEPVMVAAYAFASTLNRLLLRATPVRYFIEILRTLFFAGGGDVPHEVVAQRFVLLAKLTWILMIPAYALVVALYEPLTGWLLDGKYQQYGWVVMVMLGVGLYAALEIPVTLVLQLRERSDLMFYGNFFALYNLLMDWWLIPRIGLAGALVATGSALVMRMLFWWWFIRADAPLGRLTGFLLRSAVYWALYVLLVRWLVTPLPSDWQQVLAGLAVGGVLLLLYPRLALFTPLEAQLVRTSLGKRLVPWLDRLHWLPVHGAAA